MVHCERWLVYLLCPEREHQLMRGSRAFSGSSEAILLRSLCCFGKRPVCCLRVEQGKPKTKTLWGFTFENKVKRLDNVNVPGPLEVGLALSYGEDCVSDWPVAKVIPCSFLRV